jgi:3-deoxy-D-manno-octulosonic-acid transferase
MIWWLYNLLFPLVFVFLLPKYLLRMAKRGGYAKDFPERFGTYPPDVKEKLSAPGPVVWVQAVSVGEIGIARSFIDALAPLVPEARFVLSTNTSTGYALAQKAASDKLVPIYFPLDFPPVVKRAFRAIRPDLLVLVENEMWPNIMRRCVAEKVPMMLVNARISEHSFRGYKKIRFLTRDLLPKLSRICAQSDGDRERLLALGAREEAAETTGSAKYDIPATSPEAAAAAEAYLAKIFPPGASVLCGGSTWPGEEAVLLDWFGEARKKFPDLRLVLVPRHAERRDEVVGEIERRGFRYAQKSRPEKAAPEGGCEVALVDTTGELRGFYAASDVVFVGKSLCEKGGQNPIEPAADGKAVVTGPHLENFPAIKEDFLAAGAIAMAKNAEELGRTFDKLLSEPDTREGMGRRAQELVRAKAGATHKMALRAQELLASRLS